MSNDTFIALSVILAVVVVAVLAVALILAVTAELVIGSAGLGRSISVAQSGGAIDVMYALIIATGMLGWLLNILATSGERRVLHWHPSQRELPA